MADDYTLLDENDALHEHIEVSWPFTPYDTCPNCGDGVLKVAYSDMSPPALRCSNFDPVAYNPKSTDRFRHDGGNDSSGQGCDFHFVKPNRN